MFGASVAVLPLRAADTFAWPDPVDSPAEIMPLASQSLLLGLARTANGYVAVGGRGDILVSSDGAQWKQAEVPTRSTLTAVAAVDANIWAVGHDGVIVHSADGGDHWQLQRKDPWQAPAGDAPSDPRQGAPLLGVLFTDTKHGFAVGAYSLALRTDDGGEHWQQSTVAPI
ncbi:MAG TPA: YCF48-related protein, partial [Rudaea sp.]|nr:YCF48-related protein [Rudaea sp.]